MDKKSKPDQEFEKTFSQLKEKIPPQYGEILSTFCNCYQVATGPLFEKAKEQLLLFFKLLDALTIHSHTFEPYHQKVRQPVDYYQFGIEFIRPLVDLHHSKVVGSEHLDLIANKLEQKENVILLANHQTETDPQAISLLLEKSHPKLAEQIIYVAGEKVVTDPLAIPFSMGCDLLCIYSKRHIDFPIELKQEKINHNKKTVEKMISLLQEGGKTIYVAPSGGRDRKHKGVIQIAPFDPNSVEMFYLSSKKSKRKTHFTPLTLATYDLLPPPEQIERGCGEIRVAKRTAIHLGVSPFFDMEHFKGSEEIDKLIRRQNRALAIHSIIEQMYNHLIEGTSI